jgi:Chain length determinant protein
MPGLGIAGGCCAAGCERVHQVAVSNDGEASLATIVRALWRNKRSIIGPSLIVAAAAFIAVNLMPPKYQSEARVLFEGRENIFLRPEADKTMLDRGTLDQEALASQVQLVLSRELAREVIGRLDLAEIPEFNSVPVGFSVMTIPRMLGLARDPQSMSLEERLLAAYYERLNAYAVDESRVIVIEFLSSDPEASIRRAPRLSNSRSKRRPPAIRMCNCEPSSAKLNRSATCSRPTLPNTARRRRGTALLRRPPMLASSPAQSFPTCRIRRRKCRSC